MPRSPISVAPPAPAPHTNEHFASSQPPAYSLASQSSSIRPPQPSSTLRAHVAPSPVSPTQPQQPTPAHAQAFLERWCCGGPGVNGKYTDPATTMTALVRLGVDTTLANHWGEPPLFMAAYRGRTAIVEALLQTGASPDCTDKPGRAPLWAACRGGHVSTVEALLRNELKSSLEDAMESEVAPENDSQNQGDNDTVVMPTQDELVAIGRERRLVSALDVCAVFNKIDCARLLMRYITGRLATAAPPRRLDVPMLLEHPVHTAARHANSEIIRVWMRHSGSPHSVDGVGVTPLHRVCDNRGQVDTRSLRLIVGATRPRLPPRRTRARGRPRAWVRSQ